jgi:hypothetical protein
VNALVLLDLRLIEQRYKLARGKSLSLSGFGLLAAKEAMDQLFKSEDHKKNTAKNRRHIDQINMCIRAYAHIDGEKIKNTCQKGQ